MKIDDIGQAFQKLEEISNSTEISDFTISQLNPYNSVKELESIAKELNYGEGITFRTNHLFGNGEIIQSKLVINFIKTFFSKSNIIDQNDQKKSNIIIAVADYDEFYRSRDKIPNIDQVMFSIKELKIINDNHKKYFENQINLINDNIKLDVYNIFGYGPILVHGNYNINELNLNNKMFNFLFSKHITNLYINNKGELFGTKRNKEFNFGKFPNYSMMQLYGLSNTCRVEANRNKIELINQGSNIISNFYKNNNQTRDGNFFIDQVLYEKGWVYSENIKTFMNPEFYFKKPNITDDIRLEILDYCRGHNFRIYHEPTLKQSMEKLIKKMFEIKKSKL